MTKGYLLWTQLKLAAVLCAASASAIATPVSGYGSFVYSNLCWSKESGDAEGIRVTFLRYPTEAHVLFEWSEGPLYERMASKVSFDPVTARITFEVDMDATMTSPDLQHYSGEMSNEELTLVSVSNPGRLYRLPRVESSTGEGRTCSR